MVENELSIRAAQTRKIALKMAEHSIEKLSLQSAKEISALRSKIEFKELKQEYALFDKRKACLKENIEALWNKSALKAQEVVLKNKIVMDKLEWSYVKIDRSNPDHEVIRKQIATHRHESVIIDNEYEKVKLAAKWDEKNHERDIQFKSDYAEIVSSSYGTYPKLEDVNYKEFLNKVNEEYENIKKSTQEELNSLMPEIDNTINKAFEITFLASEKEQILSLTNEIIALKEHNKDLSIELINDDIDLQVLNEQIKEKLDVTEEKKNLEAKMSLETKEQSEVLSKIEELSKQLDQQYSQYAADEKKDFSVEIDHKDEEVKNLLGNISQSFKEKGDKAFLKVYNYVKEFIIQKCPFYYDFLKQKELDYEKEVASYRESVKPTLSADVAKAYANEDEYLKFISSSQSNNEEALSSIDKKHEENLANAKKNYQQSLVNIKEAKKNRKAEYLEQKAAAKVSLKLADGTKASEIKEVLKIYKKDVNAGEFKRYSNALKNYIKAVKEENKRYKNEKQTAILPQALSLKMNYKEQVKQDRKEKHAEVGKNNKVLRKDLSLSKYRKNLNTTSRENALGYLFLSVWAVGFIIFTLIPIGYTILMCGSKVIYDNQGYSQLISFSFSSGLTFPSWTGKDNFETLFLSDVDFAYTYVPQFFRSMLFYLPIVVFIGFVLAMLLNSKIKGRTFFRIIYFLPVVIVSGPVLSMLNESNTSGSSSIRLTLDGSSVAKILESLSPTALKYANEVFQNFIIILWMTGVPIVLFISALQKINKQLYEAAEIDGANKWQMLWTITFPLIKSVLLIVCLYTIMQITTINVSFVNPINSWLETRMDGSNYNLGITALGAWVQTFIVLIFVLICYALFREKEFVSKDKNYEEMEEAKRKKAQRSAKMAEFFHTKDIANFFAKVFAPVTKVIAAGKERRKQKKEMEG